MTDAVLRACLRVAADRFFDHLQQALPRAAPLLLRYLKRVPAGPQTVDICLAVRSFPAFSMPAWLLSEARQHDETGFLTDLGYSTLNGYYGVRLIDNIADGDGPPELKGLLPAAGYFFSEFEAPYRAYFGAEHPFWPVFRGALAEQADAAASEAHLGDITRALFLAVSAHKFAAAKGPLAAAAYRVGREAELGEWFGFIDLLGAHAQLINDLFDWHHDALTGTASFVQSEYHRQCPDGPELARWMVAGGFDWAVSELETLADALQRRAAGLGPDCIAWLMRRQVALTDDLARGRAGLRLVEILAKERA